MTIRPRVARALKDARARLRDAAAAAHSCALADSERAASLANDESDTLDELLDAAVATLSEARTVDDLARVAEATGVQRLAVAEASAQHARMLAAAEVTATRLRVEARKLRSAERVVELAETQLERGEARAEQRSCDDLAARRR